MGITLNNRQRVNKVLEEVAQIKPNQPRHAQSAARWGKMLGDNGASKRKSRRMSFEDVGSLVIQSVRQNALENLEDKAQRFGLLLDFHSRWLFPVCFLTYCAVMVWIELPFY